MMHIKTWPSITLRRCDTSCWISRQSIFACTPMVHTKTSPISTHKLDVYSFLPIDKIAVWFIDISLAQQLCNAPICVYRRSWIAIPRCGFTTILQPASNNVSTKEVPTVLYIDNQPLCRNLMNINAAALPKVCFGVGKISTMRSSIAFVSLKVSSTPPMLRRTPTLLSSMLFVPTTTTCHQNPSSCFNTAYILLQILFQLHKFLWNMTSLLIIFLTLLYQLPHIHLHLPLVVPKTHAQQIWIQGFNSTAYHSFPSPCLSTQTQLSTFLGSSKCTTYPFFWFSRQLYCALLNDNPSSLVTFCNSTRTYRCVGTSFTPAPTPPIFLRGYLLKISTSLIDYINAMLMTSREQHHLRSLVLQKQTCLNQHPTAIELL